MQYTILGEDVRVGKARTAIIIHSPRRSVLRLGLTVCDACGERWGKDGCAAFREAAALLISTAAKVPDAPAFRRLLADLPPIKSRRPRNRPDQGRRGGRPTGRRRSLRALGSGLYQGRVA